MAAVPGCPDPRELRRLLLGCVSDEAGERLEQHVERCPHCGQLLPRLKAEDDLVETVRASHSFSLGPEDRQAVQDLIPRLYSLGPEGSSRAEDGPNDAEL